MRNVKFLISGLRDGNVAKWEVAQTTVKDQTTGPRSLSLGPLERTVDSNSDNTVLAMIAGRLDCPYTRHCCERHLPSNPPPQPAKPWTGVRSAKEFGSVCYQSDFKENSPPVGDEDCLYLNVYTPTTTPDEPLAVMFWIHGGGFASGSGNDDMFGPEFLIRHNVVLVTINYRLEGVGFLCLDTPEIPGNAGMKDQVAALRWVNKNIGHFGGDSDNVTIFGESAGGASVGYHLVSPMSKGLFKTAIVQSGNAACWWSQYTAPRERGLALAKKFGCDSEDSKDLYEFFKNLPISNLVYLKVPITMAQSIKSAYECTAGVVSEKDFGQERFFYGDFTHSNLASQIHEGVEVFAGYTADDGLICLGLAGDFEIMRTKMNTFYEEFVPKHIELSCPIYKQLEAGKKMKNHYFPNGKIERDQWESIVKYFTDLFFVYDTTQWINNIASLKKNKVFLYRFSCLSERNVFAKVVGLENFLNGRVMVCHEDDLMYLFNAKEIIPEKVDKNSKEFQLIDNVTKLWTNIAKFGNPTRDDSFEVTWPAYSLEKKEFLDIRNEMEVLAAPNKEQMECWEDIFRSCAPELVDNGK